MEVFVFVKTYLFLREHIILLLWFVFCCVCACLCVFLSKKYTYPLMAALQILNVNICARVIQMSSSDRKNVVK